MMMSEVLVGWVLFVGKCVCVCFFYLDECLVINYEYVVFVKSMGVCWFSWMYKFGFGELE